ncbi:MAG TPA: ABC transporter substrate-binding protein [Candidatus Dormibacteraeota bacterium]|nr:ABC transporter substrate-binding protein [Candidatus Dormibacteraeota bacterium]
MDVRTLSRSALAAVGVAAALAACGSSSTSTSSGGGAATTADTATAAVRAEVPAAVRSRGTLSVAADASYAPNEFIDTDGSTVIGMDADLAKALGQVMGLSVTLTNVKFDNIIPGLAGGKYDLGMSSFTDTKEREKTVDFVTYFSAGTSFFVKASGGPSIATLDDLCGHNVSVEKGTTQLDDATKQDGTCKTAGKQGVTVLAFDDQNGANLALQSGRADVSMADSPVAAYQVKLNAAFKISGQPYGTAPYGIAIPKGNGMAQPILDALKLLVAGGTYTQILNQWGISAGAITAPVINGATS